MTSKRGYTPRKKRPKPSLEEEPPLVVNCVCPQCDGSFVPEQLQGGYLNRLCPHCSMPVNGATYDAKAAQLLVERASTTVKLDSLRKSIIKANSIIAKERPWHVKPLRWLMCRRRKRLVANLETVDGTARMFKQRLNALAKMRYYTSEWYLRTRIPLERKNVASCSLKAEYTQKGNWAIHPTNAAEAGMLAEMSVAQMLFERAADPSSPLFRAQILPNIYLPRQASDLSSFWTQIDCVVLTRQAAFMIEVKRHSKHIVILSSHPQTIFSTKSDATIGEYREQYGPWQRSLLESLGFDTSESKALSQNAWHASTFDEVCPHYGLSNIFEQVVFVQPRSFENPNATFIDNANVSCAGMKRSPFLNVLEEQCEKLPPITSQEAVDELGELLLERYGDLNQKRGMLHERRLSRKQGR